MNEEITLDSFNIGCIIKNRKVFDSQDINIIENKENKILSFVLYKTDFSHTHKIYIDLYIELFSKHINDSVFDNINIVLKYDTYNGKIYNCKVFVITKTEEDMNNIYNKIAELKLST